MQLVEIRHCSEDLHSCSVFPECSVLFCKIMATLPNIVSWWDNGAAINLLMQPHSKLFSFVAAILARPCCFSTDYTHYRRGSHIRVAFRSFATRIQNLDRWKSSLITWLLFPEALDRLVLHVREFKGQKQPYHLGILVDVNCSEFVLISS